jgi:hypothetical protein
MRHQEHSKGGILSKLLEGESIHIEAISILSPSMPTFNAPSKYVPDLRGELMSISIATMTYPNLVRYLHGHAKESAPPLPEMEDCINEHGSYFLTNPSTPCLYEIFFQIGLYLWYHPQNLQPFLAPCP